MAELGRPTIYSDELAADICSRISCNEKVSDICQDEAMPAARTIYYWLSKNKDFAEQYSLAQADRTHAMAEEIIDISDDGSNDWMERKNGDSAAWIANGEAIQRSRLRVDTRKWLMSKSVPKKYGDKVANEHSGPNGGPIETKDVSAIELINSRISSLASRTTKSGSDGRIDTETSNGIVDGLEILGQAKSD